MKYLILTLCIVSAVGMSCQKEYSLDDGITPNDLTSNPLIRLVQKTGSDSIVYQFTYDDLKRLIAVNSVEVYRGSVYVYNYEFRRDGSGRIVKTIATDDQTTGEDVTIYYYNSGGSVRARVNSYVLGDLLQTDSTVLVYNNMGALVGENYYSVNLLAGTLLLPLAKTSYTIDASGNILQSRDSTMGNSPNSYELNRTVLYTYDNKLNPLRLPKNDAYALGLTAFGAGFAPTVNFVTFNNLLKEEFIYPDPLDNFTYAYSGYLYNNRSKPVSSKVNDSGLNNAEVEIFYYYE